MKSEVNKMEKCDYHIVVEQRRDDEYRNNYDPKRNTFEKTEFKSLLFERKLNGVYGWVDGYGNPPNKHLDVILITNNQYSLGDKIPIKMIGVFIRKDNDNKLIAIEDTRIENDIIDLPIEEQKMIKALYPIIKNGEGWFGKEAAIKHIDMFNKSIDEES